MLHKKAQHKKQTKRSKQAIANDNRIANLAYLCLNSLFLYRKKTEKKQGGRGGERENS